jgi:hypothetical protein
VTEHLVTAAAPVELPVGRDELPDPEDAIWAEELMRLGAPGPASALAARDQARDAASGAVRDKRRRDVMQVEAVVKALREEMARPPEDFIRREAVAPAP